MHAERQNAAPFADALFAVGFELVADQPGIVEVAAHMGKVPALRRSRRDQEIAQIDKGDGQNHHHHEPHGGALSRHRPRQRRHRRRHDHPGLDQDLIVIMIAAHRKDGRQSERQGEKIKPLAAGPKRRAIRQAGMKSSDDQ